MSNFRSKRAVTTVAALVAVLIAIPLIWFISNTTTIPERQRPAGVPETAFWQGGQDGGFYFHLTRRDQDPAGQYYAEIYNDFSGTLEYRGMLVMQAAGDPVFDPDDPDQVNYWDGDNLGLMDGRVLRATTEFEPAANGGG